MHVPQTEVILSHAGTELARVILLPGEYVIGRSAETDIRADTPLISRRHARLTINYDQLLLEDLGSSNGTFVNEQPLTEATRLFPNQTIRLGDVTLEVRRQRTLHEPGLSLAPAQATIRRLLPEEVLAEKRYAIGSVVARGGMGAILDARQTAIDRTVAMKVMLETGDEADVLRFIDEAKITGQLDHPNIVPIYELGVDEQDQLFYTMKFVRGITLKKVLELLADGVEATVKKYPLPALLTIFQKACDAVAFAHSKGVIHRDLKPENIMLGDFGSVLVMDWGLAKVLGAGTGSAGPSIPQRSFVMSARRAEGQSGSTLAGSIMGTPQYMAPEQARGEVDQLDARADIYALGAILYHLLALRPSVSGDDAWAIVDKVARGNVEPLVGRTGSVRRPTDAAKQGAPSQRALPSLPGGRIPDSLAAIVRKAMALAPTARYRSVEDLQADILAYQNGFATSAEQAGAFRQVVLLLKRHKAVASGIAAVLLLGSTLGTKAFIEGRRAERALADLKRSAPAMLALAESEAVAQRFDSELEKTDIALRLDPDLAPAYWRRAWALVALGRFADAATALQTAMQHDRSHASQFIGILPQIQKNAALPDEAARYAPENIAPVFDFLNARDVRGEAGALIAHLKLSNEKRFTLAKERLTALCGGASGLSFHAADGLIELLVAKSQLKSLEQLRGLPIDILNATDANFESLEPLRGTRLVELILANNALLKDLSPLAGMRLRKLNLFRCENVTDLSPLRGMPLEELFLDGCGVADLSPLKGGPLRVLTAGMVTDFRALSESPLETLTINGGGHVVEFSGLAGVPLKTIIGTSAAFADLTPLLRIPTLERLTTSATPDKLAPLRKHPKLAFINWRSQGYRPVAEFWKDFDAQQAAKK